MRRTADRVDAQMRAYRADQSIHHVWQAKERLIVCVGPAADNETLVRATARLAAKLHADWIAVYIETPALQRQPRAERSRILDALKLAEELGAETTTLAGADAAATLSAYAVSRNAGKLVIGQPRRRSLWKQLLRPSLADQLVAATRELDVFLIKLDTTPPVPASPRVMMATDWHGYLWAIGICAATTALAAPLLSVFDLANVVMVFLLAVVGVASVSYTHLTLPTTERV